MELELDLEIIFRKTCVFLLLLFSINIINSQQRGIKPTIMIVPSNVWMTQNGYYKTVIEQGERVKIYDYQRAFDNDPLLNTIINSTGGKFAERGFNLVDMNQSLKLIYDRIEKNNITGKTLNILDELALEVSSDIILELDFNIKNTSLGRKMVDRFSMTAFDTYSSENLGKAGLPGSPSTTPSDEILVLERVESFISNLESDIIRVFEGYLQNGRKIRLEVIASEEVVDFGCYDYYGTELSNGKLLFEFFEDWVYENGFNGNGNVDPSPSGEIVNLIFNIPLVDENGRNVKSLNYATKLLRDNTLRSMFKMRPEQVGLGHSILNLTSCN